MQNLAWILQPPDSKYVSKTLTNIKYWHQSIISSLTVQLTMAGFYKYHAKNTSRAPSKRKVDKMLTFLKKWPHDGRSPSVAKAN